MERVDEASPRTVARIAGIFYLLDILASLLGDSLAGSTHVVPGQAALTAANIIAHEPLLRLGVTANLFATACYVADGSLLCLVQGCEEELGSTRHVH